MALSSTSGSSRFERLLLLLIVAACAWSCSFRLREGDPAFTRLPDGYYALLTAGFRSGHTYLPLEPHPALLALADPYDPVANAPFRAHDMSLWHGRYYLYFGVTPVLLLFWPVAALTGWYPTETAAVAIFSFGGFLAAVVLLQAVRRRHFPKIPVWPVAMGALCLCFGSPVQALVAEGRFYEVPVSCAFLLLMLMFGAIYRSLHSPRRSLAWMAAASLAFGLSVGARPNYLFAGSSLLVLWAWAVSKDSPVKAIERSGLKAALAIIGPAALCGCGLMIYNRARFGSPFDFGVQYALTGADNRNLPLFYLGHVRPQGYEYFLGPGSWQRYFPFFSTPPTKPYGFLRYFPWCWLGLLVFLPLGRGDGGRERPWRILALAVGTAFVCNLIPLLCFFGTVDRYMSDFLPAALLLGSFGALVLVGKVVATRWIRRLAALPLGLLAISTIFVELCVCATLAPRPGLLLPLARIADWPARIWERAHGVQYGALQMELLLPTAPQGMIEPIFETGPTLSRRDWLQITYLSPDRARLDFFHAGLGKLEGRPFAVPSSRRILVTVRCGSLLPPFAHPVFRHWSLQEYETLSRDLSVSVDGREVLRAELACYPASPETWRIGTRAWEGDDVAPRFTGEVVSSRRLGLLRPDILFPELHRRAPVSLTVIFPADREAGQEPLVATGDGIRGDLLYCIYEGRGRVRFASDHADSGGPRGTAIDCGVTRAHRLDVWMGSLAEAAPAISGLAMVPPSRRVVVWMDGKVVFNELANFSPAAPESVRLGRNPFASTAVADRFSGRIWSAGQPDDAPALPVLRSTGQYGAVDLRVMFPDSALGSTEPVVVTGATGIGDLLYVKYLDSGHISFGFDHWGVGGLSGPPVDVDLGLPHHLEVAMSSLFPPGGAGPWTHRVVVRMDGATVLEGVSDCHPSWPDQIEIGRNSIGGSTCGPIFTGRILAIERPAQPR